jgi:hypothetical protein
MKRRLELAGLVAVPPRAAWKSSGRTGSKRSALAHLGATDEGTTISARPAKGDRPPASK